MKQLFYNFIYIGLSRVVDFGIPLIIMPYLISVVGGENYGRYAFAFSLIFYFLNIVQYGFNLTAVRELAINNDDREKINKICSNVLTTKIYLISLAFIVLQLLTYFLPAFKRDIFLTQTLFLMVIGDSMYCKWYFQGVNKMKYITIVNLLSKLSYLILVLTFIKKSDDYIYIGLCQSVGYIVSGLVALYLIFVKDKVIFNFTSFSDVIITLKSGVNAFMTMSFPVLYSNTSMFLLGLFAAPIYSTFLDVAVKISRAFSALNPILNQVLYPFVAKNNSDKKVFKLQLKIYTISGLLSTILMISSASLTTRILAPEYFERIIPLVVILGLSPLILSMKSIYGLNYLMVNNHDRIYMRIAITSSLLGFCIALLLIPFFNVYGAVIAILFARFVYCLQCYLKYRKLSKAV